MSPAILGWDIGGVNTKVTRLVAAETVGLGIVRLADRLGQSARTAPAAAVAWLLWHSMESGG